MILNFLLSLNVWKFKGQEEGGGLRLLVWARLVEIRFKGFRRLGLDEKDTDKDTDSPRGVRIQVSNGRR